MDQYFLPKLTIDAEWVFNRITTESTSIWRLLTWALGVNGAGKRELRMSAFEIGCFNEPVCEYIRSLHEASEHRKEIWKEQACRLITRKQFYHQVLQHFTQFYVQPFQYIMSNKLENQITKTSQTFDNKLKQLAFRIRTAPYLCLKIKLDAVIIL